MRVLLTGASGFLGRRVRRELRKNKHDVFCYDVRLGYNILYPDQIENTILNWKPDVIIHLAALADLNIFKQKPEVGYELNVVGTRNILNMCQNLMMNKNDLIKDIIFQYFEFYFLTKVKLAKSRTFEYYDYFLKRINDTKKFNLDEESLFMEFEYKILNG